jgi:hypothetical protein
VETRKEDEALSAMGDACSEIRELKAIREQEVRYSLALEEQLAATKEAGNIYINELRTQIAELEEVVGKLRAGIKVLNLIYECGADGVRVSSCCNGKHLGLTMMAGDKLYYVNYTDSKALAETAETAGKREL